MTTVLIATLLVGCGGTMSNQPVTMGPRFMQDHAADIRNAVDHARVAPLGERLRVVLPAALLFADIEANVQSAALPELIALAGILGRYDATQITIEGHTNPGGQADAAARDLSLRQAQAVAGVLATNGVDVKRLVIIGVGGQRPVADPETLAGEERNPRIELMITPVPAWTPPAAAAAADDTTGA